MSIVRTAVQQAVEGMRDDPVDLMMAALDILDRGPHAVAAATLSLAISHAGGCVPLPGGRDADGVPRP